MTNSYQYRKCVSVTHFYIAFALFILTLIRIGMSFNIQGINKGLVIKSKERNSQFGYSVTFHENNQGKWLIVGAPKGSKNKKKSSRDFGQKTSDGAVYTCFLQRENFKKSNCSLFNVELNQPNDVIYHCDFESGGLEQLSMDNFDWTRTKDKTPSEGTGPSRDHTYENSPNNTKGHYMFIETSVLGESLPGKSAMVATPLQKGTVGDCLRFWYHMHGDQVGSLNVYIQTNITNNMMIIWNKDGNQKNQWIEAHVTVISEEPYKIIFEGIRIHWSGDIGIDDITITKGQCIEDIDTSGQSLGSTLASNPETGDVLVCSPTWHYNCSGQIQSSGACYLFNKNLSSSQMSVVTPCRTQVCNTAPVDIVFIIDSSRSISEYDFSLIKLWLRNVVSSLPVSSGYIQVGVMVYSGTADVVFHLNKYHSIQDIRAALENMSFIGGYTNTGKAIANATENMFREENGMRPEAKRIIIVMTDGQSQDNVNIPSRKAKEKGISMIAIGVGNADEEELRTISSDPDKYIFEISDYSALGQIRSELQDSIAALESQGKISTTEQGQAGFSAAFLGNVAVIGTPGLNDWSGGYSSYYINSQSSKPYYRILTSFRDMLKLRMESSFVNSTNSSFINVATTTNYDQLNSSTSQTIHLPVSSIDVTNKISSTASNDTHVETSTKNVSQSIVPDTDLTGTFSNGSLSTNISIFPTAFSNRTKRETTVLDAEVLDTETIDLRKPTPTKESRFYSQTKAIFEINAASLDVHLTNNNFIPNSSNDFMPDANQRIFGSGDEGSADNDSSFNELQNANNIYDATIVDTALDLSNNNLPANQTALYQSKKRKKAITVEKKLTPIEDITNKTNQNNTVLAQNFSSALFSYQVTSVNNYSLDSTMFTATPQTAKPTVPILTESQTLKKYLNLTDENDSKSNRPIRSLKDLLHERHRRSLSGSITNEEDIIKLSFYAYFGYSITTGKFINSTKTDLAFGAPGLSSFGAVYVIRQDELIDNENNARIVEEFHSQQLGCYYGFTLASADTNSDGIDELIVGAPLWLDKHADEGRTFVYVSNYNKETGRLIRNEVMLSGKKENEARFGFSIVTPGDLNTDGYEDIIIGAPSTEQGDGCVYIYYGRPEGGITTEYKQVIQASKRKKRPIYFGFSLDASLDIDGNGYNDLAIGAPGNDKVVILLTRPVIHVAIDLIAHPSVLNLTHRHTKLINASYLCGGNSSKICAEISVCFKTHGKQIPNNISLWYSLTVDTQLTDGYPRGRIIEPEGVVDIVGNTTFCETFVMFIKLPVRNQLVPITVNLNFGLSDKMPSTPKSAVLDIFDSEPKSISISFAKSCQNSTCYSDLHMSCEFMHDITYGGTKLPRLVIDSDSIITINLNLTNRVDVAYDVILELLFSKDLYFIQMLPFLQNGKRCVQRYFKNSGLKQADSTELSEEEKKDAANQMIKLFYNDAVMPRGEECLIKLQYGIKSSWNGGNLNFSFSSNSYSVEVNTGDNFCELKADVDFYGKLLLRGKPKYDPIKFSTSETESSVKFGDVGPSVIHNYYVSNIGPSRIPYTSLEVSWPAMTPSGHTVLYLTNATCWPSNICACFFAKTINDSKIINETAELMSDENDGIIDLAQNKELDYKEDEITGERFSDAVFDCLYKNSYANCSNLRCKIEHLLPGKTVQLQLEFRLWKQTFLKSKVWNVTVFTNGMISTKLSPNIVDLNRKNNIQLITEVKTEAFNANFTLKEENTEITEPKWWIYVLAILVGIFLLLLTILILRKIGFFKSKYKQHIQEELEWTTTYNYTMAKQSEVDQPTDKETSGNNLSTFQRQQRPL